jgi:hypothetical protein
MGEGRDVYSVLVGWLEGEKPLEDLGIGGMIILRRNFGR